MSALDHQEGGNHYAKLSIQPIEYIHANGLGFAEGSVIKYVTRWRDKNGIADLKKARHFLDLLIELEEKSGIVGMTAQEAIEFEDKELPSSGIYGDEGYTEADKQAASLDRGAECLLCYGTGDMYKNGVRDGWCVHPPINNRDAVAGYHIKHKTPWAFMYMKQELDPALVELCSNTTIHADADGWIEHVGNHCPVADLGLVIQYKRAGWKKPFRDFARDINWAIGINSHEQLRVTKWRYAK